MLFMRPFFHQIVYSAANEDSRSELRALQLNTEDRVLCITGSGSRPLDLLTAVPGEIVSVDFNPCQSHLLRLKIAAIQALDYDQFSDFIGLTPSEHRLETYLTLRNQLPKYTAFYWDKNHKALQRGILYCGQWERYLGWLSQLRHIRGKQALRLFQSTSLEEQQALWKAWDTPFWRKYVRMSANRFFWEKVVREPGAKLVARDFDIGGYMLECFDILGNHLLMRNSHFARLLFFGHYDPHEYLPLHLQAQHFQTLKENIHRIQPVTASLLDYLKPERSGLFSAFSISDFSSYAPWPIYKQIWQQVLDVAQAGAHFCERQYLVKHEPQDIFPEINRKPELEAQLRFSDHAFIYSFAVGTLKN